MKALKAAWMAAALAAAPVAAVAQGHHGGFSHAAPGFGGGHAGAGFHGGFADHGGGHWGGYRNGYGWGGFGLGLALGAAFYEPWYSPAYYPGYYGYPVVYDDGPYYVPASSGVTLYDDEAPVAASRPSGPAASGQVCGQWVWRQDPGRYDWVSSACAPSS